MRATKVERLLDDGDIAALASEYAPIIGPGAVLRLAGSGDGHLLFTADGERLAPRPGGTISGPALFGVVDIAGFITVNAFVGSVPTAALLQADVQFLEAAEPGPLFVTVRIVKLSRRFAITAVRVEDDTGCILTTASMIFALPSRTGGRRAGHDASAGELTT